MLAVVGGLGAAVAFTVTTLCASRSSRMLGSASVLAWVMLTGLVVVTPFAAVAGRPKLDDESLALLTVSGLGNVIGLLFVYSALRLGKVGIVAPIASTEGAVAAVIAVIAGEQIQEGMGVALAAIALGIALAAAARDHDDAHVGPAWLVVLLASAAAFSFGCSLYATGRVSEELPIAWAIVPARLAGVLLVAIPLALSARLRLTRQALPLVVAAGVGEVVGFALFAMGSRHGIAVSAVLASQFAALSAVAAYFLFGERLGRVQVVGVATIVAGVAALTLIQA